MKTSADVQAYLDQFPDEVQVILNRMRQTILESLAQGFEETLQYGMITYVVPLSLYPKGYLNNPKVPLPYVAIAKQKHHYAFYSMGLFMIQDLFQREKALYETSMGRLDHGVSCLRFRSEKKIPYTMLKNVVSAISCESYIDYYVKAKGA